ncbi:hypothetical protein T440DRAFT_510833 [Plenodomus tracheiphilus IPT5]|uniref:Tat pathway signal sequence n=1 Tax=Plenodomus tracheiphilus IPT5 TaxID=1408161 RepID=A0A6A7AWN0_9PLEO|nr:hypothetical protein T440DRAFT_510833 [Plenodomus tracheiphilus IPT5]
MSWEPFLPRQSQDEIAEDDYFNKPLHSLDHELEGASHAHRIYHSARGYVFNIAFAICNSLLFVILILRHDANGRNHLPSTYSPAESAVRYNSTYFDKYGHLGGNPFSQPPGPELDEAWHGLLAGMNIVVSSKWLDEFGTSSVRLADGSGVLGQLGVYHELHCLKKLKHWNYRAHYYEHLADVELKEEEIHVEHCLEWLRIAALCRSDITLTTFQWEGVNGSRLATEYPIPRQCVDSARVLQWSEDRAIDITQEGVLEHE